MAVHGLERCLSLYPLDHWQVFEEELIEADLTDDGARRSMRQLLASTVDLEMDAQGRVTLTPELLERARIKGAAVLNGMVTHLELWSPELWDEYINTQGLPLEVSFKSLKEQYRKSTARIKEIRGAQNGGAPDGSTNGGSSGSGD